MRRFILLVLSLAAILAIPATAAAAPAVPGNLHATATTDTSVTLAWEASNGATSYEITVDDGSSDLQIGATGNLTFVADKHGPTLQPLAPNTSYWFGVRARAADGTSSARAWVQVSTSSGAPPPNPNDTVPTASQLATWRANAPTWFPAAYRDAVTGNKTGTTREILEWAATKWNIPTVYAFAQAWKESGWNQAENGDGGLSWGILQQKQTSMTGSFPLSRDSTAFSADLGLALVRAYADGALWIPADPTLWAAYGAYFSGSNCPVRWVQGPTIFPSDSPACADIGAAEYERAIMVNVVSRPWDG